MFRYFIVVVGIMVMGCGDSSIFYEGPPPFDGDSDTSDEYYDTSDEYYDTSDEDLDTLESDTDTSDEYYDTSDEDSDTFDEDSDTFVQDSEGCNCPEDQYIHEDRSCDGDTVVIPKRVHTCQVGECISSIVEEYKECDLGCSLVSEAVLYVGDYWVGGVWHDCNCPESKIVSCYDLLGEVTLLHYSFNADALECTTYTQQYVCQSQECSSEMVDGERIYFCVE